MTYEVIFNTIPLYPMLKEKSRSFFDSRATITGGNNDSTIGVYLCIDDLTG